MAESRRTEPQDAPSLPSILVAIPCLNEEPTVARVVRMVPREIPGFSRVHVIVFDDGSTDGTAEAGRTAGAEVVRSSRNQGLGASFRRAVQVAVQRRFDVLVNIDGDGQFDAADIPRLLEPILDGRAEMVTASRFLDPSLVPDMPAVKKWGNRRMAGVVRLLTGKRYQDVSCGFRAFTREALLRMNLFGGFTYTQESFLDLSFKNLVIVEVPVKVRGVREFGSSRVASNVFRYGIRSLLIMLRAFLSYRPMLFFLTVGAIFLVPGVSLFTFLLVHYLRTGGFHPHIWAGFVGGAFCLLSILTLVMGFLGDMLVRIRLNQETMLYVLKKTEGQASSESQRTAQTSRS